MLNRIKLVLSRLVTKGLEYPLICKYIENVENRVFESPYAQGVSTTTYPYSDIRKALTLICGYHEGAFSDVCYNEAQEIIDRLYDESISGEYPCYIAPKYEYRRCHLCGCYTSVLEGYFGPIECSGCGDRF